MDQDKFLQLQMQMKHNQTEYANFLDDLDSWSTEIKAKDRKISEKHAESKKPNGNSDKYDIRSQNPHEKKKPKINAYDYRSWDKFDVEAALQELDEGDREIGVGRVSKEKREANEVREKVDLGAKGDGRQRGTELSDLGDKNKKKGKEIDEKIENNEKNKANNDIKEKEKVVVDDSESRRQLSELNDEKRKIGIKENNNVNKREVNLDDMGLDKKSGNGNQDEKESAREREEGNALFREAQFTAAIERYTAAIVRDPRSTAALVNRALALTRIGRHLCAERDCSEALRIDPRCVKALYQRAKCRSATGGDVTRAIADLSAALDIDPHNAAARALRDRLSSRPRSSIDPGVIQPIFTTPESAPASTLTPIAIIDVDPRKSAFTNHSQSIESQKIDDNRSKSENPIESINNQSIIDDENRLKSESSEPPISNQSTIIDNCPAVKPQPQPQTALQLARDLARVRSDETQLAQYVSRLDRERYARIIGHSLDDRILLDLFNGLSFALSLGLISPAEFVDSVLCVRERVPRFSSTWMMIPSADKRRFEYAARSLSAITGEGDAEHGARLAQQLAPLLR